jgi:DNA polymerase-3 subunit beta
LITAGRNDLVVPSKTLSEVIKLLIDDGKKVSLGVGKRHMCFEVGSYSVIFKTAGR